MKFWSNSTCLILVCIALGLTACDNTKRVKGNAFVGTLGSVNASALTSPSYSGFSNKAGGLSTEISKWEDVIQGSSSYSWAKVDGLKINLKNINGETADDGASFKSFDPPKPLEIGGGVSHITMDEELSIPVGIYNRVGFEIQNKMSIKAFCRTSTKTLYTTTNGIKECTDSSSPCTGDLPSDYDYYEYDFIHAGRSSTIWEGNALTFEITESSTPQLILLVDSSYIASCADSTADLDGADSGKLAPFSWSVESGQMSDYYQGTEGNFGVGYLPVFAYLNTNPDEELPVGETYAISGDEADVPDVGDPNLFNSLITTIAFDEAGDIIAARSRNFDGNHGTTLEQGWSGFQTPDIDGNYVMMNGEHWEGDLPHHRGARWLENRKVEDFKRIDTRQTITINDGPDCGHPRGDRGIECNLNNDEQTFWKRIPR